MKDLKFLTKQEIRKAAYSAYTKEPLSTLSDRYTHIPTSRVIEDMENLGWGVVEAKQVKSRKNKGTQKHLIVFRNPDVAIEGNDGDTVYPQILLTNSHDGKNSFKFEAGLFRMICSNGLVIKSENFGSIKIRHLNYSFEELEETILNMVEMLPLTVESMNTMKQIQLDQKQILDFAKKATGTRFPKDQLNRIKIDYEELVKPTRKEDEGTDLWSVFNIVQEKLIEGDFEYRSANKIRKARKIKNFIQDQKVNQDLFELALEYTS